MSVKVSSWVWHGDETAELAGNEMILLLALADVADDNGRCRYVAEDDDLTYTSLAKKARVSRSTLIRLLAKLREDGLVDQTRGVKGKPNEFSILVPWSKSFGVNLEPKQDSVSSGADSVSSELAFGLIADESSSYRRKDVDVRRLFDEFYAAYPRKVGRAAALTAFERAAKKTDPQQIVTGARRYAADPNLPEKQFIPHPSTWLGRGSWDDEALPSRSQPAAVGAPAPLSSDFASEDSWMAFNR